MKKKANRLDAIKMIISSKDISSQEELLQALGKEGFELTQATLSGNMYMFFPTTSCTSAATTRAQAKC